MCLGPFLISVASDRGAEWIRANSVSREMGRQ
jgi:hypothetical protein